MTIQMKRLLALIPAFLLFVACTDSPIIYYSLVILSSLALGFFVAYVWIPLVQWLHAYL